MDRPAGVPAVGTDPLGCRGHSRYFVARAGTRNAPSTLTLGVRLVYYAQVPQLWRKRMSDVAEKMARLALVAVLIPAALLAGCASQPAPPPPQPVAASPPPPPPPPMPPVRGSPAAREDSRIRSSTFD